MPRLLSLDIFSYLDYRRFLRDAYHDLKLRQARFSFRRFAQSAGLSTPNYLKLVMDGKRNLTPDTTERFGNALGLDEDEMAYFRDLVPFGQAKTSSQKNHHFERLSRNRRRLAVRPIERSQLEYFSHWYNVVIRELAACEGFREDPEWIARQLRPSITAAQAQRAITLLLELGFLRRDQDGRLRQGELLVSTGPEVRTLAVTNFHHQMIERAAAALDTVPFDERDITALVLPLDADGLERFKERVVAFRRELLELSAAERAPVQVVQINFQLFPLTVRVEEEDQ